MTKLTKMQEFYKGKTIFITGASGFMGKVLLEKLLYSCSDVKQIMILVRPKRGKSAAQRVQDFSTLPVSVFIYYMQQILFLEYMLMLRFLLTLLI